MTDLIKRLEEAEAGSVALNGDIHRALFPADLLMTDAGSVGPKARAAVRQPIGDLPTMPGSVIAECMGVPNYTTSLDAALALAERLGLDGWHPLYAAMLNWKAHDPRGPLSKTLPLALCIAILKATDTGREG